MNKTFQINESTSFNSQSGEFTILPQIIQFVADRTIVSDDKPVIISWEVENAVSVSINNTKVSKKGSKELLFNETKIVQLTAKSRNNIKIDRAIKIEIDKRPPIIRSFSPNVLCAIKGSPVTLFWDIVQAREVYIDNGIGDVSGLDSKTVTIGESGVYKITARNYFGVPAEARIEITIFPIPLIDGIFVPQPHFKFDRFFLKRPFVDFNQLPTVPFATDSTIELLPFSFAGNELFEKNICLNKELMTINLNLNDLTGLLTDDQRKISSTIKALWKKILKIWGNMNTV